MTAREVPGEAELLAGLDESQRRRVLAAARDRAVDAGETLFRVGERAESLFLVREGELELTFPLVVRGEARETRLRVVRPGGALAWSALVPPHVLTLGARAATAARLVELPGPATLALLEAEPALGRIVLGNVARVVAGRFQEVLALYVREVHRGLEQTYR